MWALWPGSGKFYKATVAEKAKTVIRVTYFDGEERKLKYNQVEVILNILELRGTDSDSCLARSISNLICNFGRM